MTDYQAQVADWQHDADAIRAIRTRVFIEEQQVPAELEWDGLDDSSTHFAVRADNRLVATARLKPDGQIGRMAVLPEYRGRGIGASLLRAVLDHARKSGFERVYLHAQVKVIGFYEKYGFEAEGDVFMDAGIPHRAMWKICAK